MAKSAEQYFREMCTDAGLDEATTAAYVTLANNEKLSPRMNELIRRATDDFSAMQGRVSASEGRVKTVEDWYNNQAKPEYDRAIAELQAYRSAGNGHVQQPNFDESRYLTKEDFVKLNQDRDNRYAAVIKDATRLASRHAAKFGEELDVDALEKIASERGVPLSVAYDQLVSPRIEEKRKSDMEAQIKAAREEGAREALSRHKLPIDPVPPVQSFIRNRPAKDSLPKDVDAELLAAWNGVKAS